MDANLKSDAGRKLIVNLKSFAGALRVMSAITLISPLWPRLALAHAFPAAEEPRVGSTVNAPPREVAITFDNPIEELFAKLEVCSETVRDMTASAPRVSPDHRRLSTALKPLNPGNYTVKWSVVAEDGHRTEGSFQFTVAGGPQ